jgi:signal transduction histidine kinase
MTLMYHYLLANPGTVAHDGKHPMSAFRYFRDAAVFAPCYIALDWASYIHPLGPFNITPWNPQPALAIAWMLLGGLHHAPAVLATILVADIVVRHAPGGYVITLVTAVTLACGYAVIAWLLRSLLRPVPDLRSTRQLTLFSTIVGVGTAVVGGAFIGALWLSGFLAESPALDAWLRFWVGDAVGVLVTAPLLLVAADSGRRNRLMELMRRPEILLQLALVGATLWLIFDGLGGDPSRHFYLLFLPLIWVAVRSGLNGTVVAIALVQIGVVMGVHRETGVGFPVVELQAFVAALTLTGLYLGVIVEERERAAGSLRQTLHLAAAGEMAGAVAHEVNQPLTALTNYTRSAQLLVAQGGPAAQQLPGVIEKILAEGQRAGEVVRRLRDFFRTGTTRLEPVPVDDLLASVRAIAQRMVGARKILVEVEAEDELPALYIDRLQIELVLRNLLANAVDALDARVRDDGRVRLLAQRHDPDHVRLVVADNGPGVPAASRDRLFEPFSSGKPSGMGLGLAFSRAIVQAHGGSLDAPMSEHGEFHLILPCVPKS